jgi:hypothetical protein
MAHVHGRTHLLSNLCVCLASNSMSATPYREAPALNTSLHTNGHAPQRQPSSSY